MIDSLSDFYDLVGENSKDSTLPLANKMSICNFTSEYTRPTDSFRERDVDSVKVQVTIESLHQIVNEVLDSERAEINKNRLKPNFTLKEPRV